MKKSINNLFCTLLLAFSLFSSCQEENLLPTETREGLDLLNQVAMDFTMPNTNLSLEEKNKLSTYYQNIDFGEMERLIDLRYRYEVEYEVFEEEFATELREKRHYVNKVAKENYGELMQSMDEEKLSVAMDMYRGLSFEEASTNQGKTKSTKRNTTTGSCTPFSSNTSVPTGSSSLMGLGPSSTYIGEISLPNSNDCDQLFRFTIDKIYEPNYVGALNSASASLLPNDLAARYTDLSPNTIDCGTHQYDVVIGGVTVLIVFGTPQNAASQLYMNLKLSIQTGWCYTGSWGSEKWYLGGVYAPQWDGWGAGRSSSGWFPCSCTESGYRVR